MYIALFDVETQSDIEAYSRYTSPTVHDLHQIIDKQAIYPIVGKEDEALHAFMAGKLQAMQDDIFLEELAELKLEYTKNLAFLLEGEEIIASF